MTIKIETRNANLADLAELLSQQQASKQDLVVPMSQIVSRNGVVTVKGTSVFGEGQRFSPTEIADGHLADKLGIPVKYLRQLRAERPDLYDANVNGWTQGGSIVVPGYDAEQRAYGAIDTFPADDRSVLLRTFVGDPDGVGVLRAVLSDRYGIIDNFDVLTAALEGVREAGVTAEVTGCDLTERRMTVRIAAPEIFVNAPALLDGYRNPFQNDGRGILDHSRGVTTWHKGNLPESVQQKYGVDANGVFAGLVITNSETGGGSFSIVPRITVLRCTNGLMLTKDAVRQIHLGAKMEDGAVSWSDDTQRKQLSLITAKARDAVQSFLSPEFVVKAVENLTEKAAKPITDPAKTIEVVAKKLAYSQQARDGILDHFIRGGQVTTGGIMQAVTAYAQTVENPDTAYDLEASAIEAMEVAFAL